MRNLSSCYFESRSFFDFEKWYQKVILFIKVSCWICHQHFKHQSSSDLFHSYPHKSVEKVVVWVCFIDDNLYTSYWIFWISVSLQIMLWSLLWWVLIVWVILSICTVDILKSRRTWLTFTSAHWISILLFILGTLIGIMTRRCTKITNHQLLTTSQQNLT